MRAPRKRGFLIMAELKPWDRQFGESNRWYDRFYRCYLMAGAKRSRLDAYRQGANRPKATQTGMRWREAYKKWRWEERAIAYDDAQRADLEKTAEEALNLLKRHRVLAAQALVDNLKSTNDTERRQAATEILDRAGVVKATDLNVSGIPSVVVAMLPEIRNGEAVDSPRGATAEIS